MTEVIDREGVATAPAATTGAARRIYVDGSRPDLRVPFREVVQSPTRGVIGETPNLPLRLYDTSGPHGDPEISVDPEAGLACACLTDNEFGAWSKTAWPELSDAVLAEAGS